MAERSSLLAVHDPALAEIAAEGSPNEEVAVVARLSEDQRLPEGVRIVTRFGDVATLRVRRDQVVRVAESASVIAVERSRALWLSDEIVREDVEAATYVRRPPGVTAVGRNVAVAAIDWGIDFGHPAFRNADGSTRLLALWDQRGTTASRPGNRWEYGRIFSREDIDRALREADPYRALDYDPADADVLDRESGEWQGSHGTHVLDIAAGSGRGGGMVGIAPEADLIFVHLARTVPVLGRSSLGDSASVLEALDFCFSVAGDKPCVVNMSVGAHGGSHSGDSAAEVGIDRAVWLKDARAVVNSAGNYFESAAHAQGRLKQGGRDFISFAVPAGDPTESEIEVYYDDVDRFTVAVIDPSGAELAAVGVGQQSALAVGATVVGHIYHQVRETGDRHVDLFLKPNAPGGVWNLRLDGDAVQDGRYHAWIERDRGPRPRFVGADIARNGTTGSLCNGRFSITVGAYDPHDERFSIADFSSAGPTRDGRVKPEILAPGVRIQAARSAAESELAGARYVLKDGTSMAAPHVAGAIAIMFEAAGKPLDIADTRALLFASARCASAPLGNQNVVDLHRRGYGYLDIPAAEQAARDWGRQKEEGIAKPASGEEEFAPAAADPLEDRLVDGDDLVPIAHARQFFPGPVEPGDRLVRSCEGTRYSARVLSARIETAPDLVARGVVVERAGSGGYVEVLEGRQGVNPARVVGRRLTDSLGRMLRGQTLFRPLGNAAPSEEDEPRGNRPMPARCDSCHVRVAASGEDAARFRDFERQVMDWVATCVSSKTPTRSGRPIIREVELVQNNPSLTAVWHAAKERRGESITVRARYQFTEVTGGVRAQTVTFSLPEVSPSAPSPAAGQRAAQPQDPAPPGTLAIDDPGDDADKDIVLILVALQKPGDVGQYWADEAHPKRERWAHALSELEQGYIDLMTDRGVPAPLRMRPPVDPANMASEEEEAAERLFGTDGQAARKYANYENRRRILAHYVLTHPATMRAQLGLYRLVRDVNPLHFALERGWQIGSGREMFTGQEVSRLGAALEFTVALALIYGIGKGLAAARPETGSPRTLPRSLDDPIYDLPGDGGGMRISGRWYTEHALERMAPDIPEVRAQITTNVGARLQRIGITPDHPAYARVLARALGRIEPRGVPPSVVEAEIAKPGSTNVRVVTARRKKVVVTVMKR